MRKAKEQMVTSKGIYDTASVNLLQQQAFKNSVQANIIFEVKSGKILLVNRAAGKLLGYSQKELLTVNKSAIFDLSESSFIKMLKKMKADGQSVARVTAIKKNGKKFLLK